MRRNDPFSRGIRRWTVVLIATSAFLAVGGSTFWYATRWENRPTIPWRWTNALDPDSRMNSVFQLGYSIEPAGTRFDAGDRLTLTVRAWSADDPAATPELRLAAEERLRQIFLTTIPKKDARLNTLFNSAMANPALTASSVTGTGLAIDYAMAVLPGLLAAGFLVLLLAPVRILALREHRRLRLHLLPFNGCIACGYSLSGLHAREKCRECGASPPRG